MKLTRRSFLRAGAAAAAAALVPGALDPLLARVAHGATHRAVGYGPLGHDPAGLLDLPAGFHYRTFSTAVLGREDEPRFTQRMTDGSLVPARHDGMAAFAGPHGRTILVRNHEMDVGWVPGIDAPKGKMYDEFGTGGTTTLWINADRELERSFVSLAGTFRNCAGGPTPWGSYLSAEECTYVPGAPDEKSHDQRPEVHVPHGYVFEVDSHAEGPVAPTPIRGMGRFYHEAVAVDPGTGFVYLTEDRADGLLYRYRPQVLIDRTKRPGELRVGDLGKGGVLEALRVIKRPSALTQNWDTANYRIGVHHAIDWVPIEDREPVTDMERDQNDPEDDRVKRRPRTASGSTRAQGFRRGCAQFARSEGIAAHGGAIYFCCTNGGRARAGQVWKLEPQRGRLTLAVEPNDRTLIDGPDNLTPAPNGDLLVCEDGRDDQFVVGITARGGIYHLAHNAHNESEFAGACFAPDGRTLFVNVQEPGITFAIWGPWEKRAG